MKNLYKKLSFIIATIAFAFSLQSPILCGGGHINSKQSKPTALYIQK